MFKIAVLISGQGSNLEAIMNRSDSSKIYEVKYVIADRECKGIELAKKRDIKTRVYNRKKLGKKISKEIDMYLKDDIDLIVLAGYLSILDEEFINRRKGKIINIHPAISEKYGGKGMYGDVVHKHVLKNKEKQSGCTVHFVDSGVDTGEIISKSIVKVMEDDTVESLKKRILIEEHKLLPDTIEKILINQYRR